MEAVSSRLDQGFSVFNLHLNSAGDRANAEFIAQFGQDKFDEHIAPLHNSGIMAIFSAEPATAVPYRVAWVALATMFVNEGRA